MVASCTTPVSEGMKITTNSRNVREARKFVVELLLSEHCGECKTCVRNNDCELQTLALELGVGFVPVRKSGKLPGATLKQEYALEYGTDRIEVSVGATPPGARVLLVDDVLATGGTLLAALQLAAQLEAQVVGGAVLVELDGLGGRERWPDGLPLAATLVY